MAEEESPIQHGRVLNHRKRARLARLGPLIGEPCACNVAEQLRAGSPWAQWPRGLGAERGYGFSSITAQEDPETLSSSQHAREAEPKPLAPPHPPRPPHRSNSRPADRPPPEAQFPQESVNQGDLTSPAQQLPRATPTEPPPQPQRQSVTGSWVRRMVAEVNEAAPPLVVGRHTPSHRDDVAAAALQTAQRHMAQQQQGQKQSGGTRSGDGTLGGGGSAVQHPPARHPLGQQQLQQPQQPQQSTALRMFHLAAKGAAQAQRRASSRPGAAAAAGQHPAPAHPPVPRAKPQPAATAPAQLGPHQHQHALPLLLPLPQLPQPPRVQASVNQAGPPGAMPPPPPRAPRSAAATAVLSAAGPSWDRPRLTAGAVDAARAAISGGQPETVLPLLVQAAAQRGAEEAGLSLELLCAHQANFEALNPVARGSRVGGGQAQGGWWWWCRDPALGRPQRCRRLAVRLVSPPGHVLRSMLAAAVPVQEAGCASPAGPTRHVTQSAPTAGTVCRVPLPPHACRLCPCWSCCAVHRFPCWRIS